MSCPDCFRGGVSTTHPSGNEKTIQGIPTYVAAPEEGGAPKGVIVFITDAFGWEFVNNRVLCDHYARGGYLVYCPDFMAGNALSPAIIPLMDKIMAPSSWSWFLPSLFYKPYHVAQLLSHAIPWKRATSIASTHPPIIAFLQALRSSPPPFPTADLKVGIAGFCWGGKHAVLLAHDEPATRVPRPESQHNPDSEVPKPLVDAVFVAHPSYLDVPGDIERVMVPLSVSVGDVDAQMKLPVVERMRGVLEEKNLGDGGEEGRYEVRVLEGAKHGFAVRTHPEDEREVESAGIAEGQALKWFGRWLR